jgi:hypothetical protein
MSGRAAHGIPHSAPHVPAEDQVRQQGIQTIASADELVFPGVWESDEELDDFLAGPVRAPVQHAVSVASRTDSG